jgi:hypothetical protein
MKANTRISIYVVAIVLAAGVLQAAETQPQGPVCNVRFAVYGNAMYPGEVHALKGSVRISIEVFSSRTSAVMVDRIEGKTKVAAGKVERNMQARHGEDVLALQPGEYEVYSNENSNARGLLIVDPN